MHPPTARGFLLLPLLVAALAQAQETPAPKFSDEIEVRVIDVDVVVTDRQGKRITTLNREDFELLEDGKPVEISYFSRIVDGRSTEDSSAAAESVQAAAPRSPVTWVVYLDQTNLPPSRRNIALRQLRTFFESGLPAGDRAMLAFNDGMSMRIRQNLTDDRKRLLDALTAVEKQRFHRGAAAISASTIKSEIRGVDPSDPEAGLLAGILSRQISAVILEEANRTKNAIHTMTALIDGMARLEGRVALLYVGAGFNPLPALDLTELWKSRFGVGRDAPRPEDEKDWLEKEVSRLYANLSATRVAVYTIHGSESGGPSVQDPGSTSPSEATFAPGDRAALTEAGLAREMAQRTGGLYFAINTALAGKLVEMRNDVSNYYSLGYRPTGTPGKERRVRVRVKAEGARVRHRATVREPTRQERAGGAVVAAALQPTGKALVARAAPAAPPTEPTEANPLGASVQAERPQRNGSKRDHILPFRFTLQLETLTFLRRGNAHRAEFVIHFAVVERNGTIWPLESRLQTLEIPESEAPAEGQNVNYSWHVDLSALNVPAMVPVNADGVQLMVTVEDRASGVRSVITSAVPKG